MNPLLARVSEPAVPASFLAAYLTGALDAAIIWWLDHQQQKTPEEMAQLVRRLTIPTMFSILGIDPAQLFPQSMQDEV